MTPLTHLIEAPRARSNPNRVLHATTFVLTRNISLNQSKDYASECVDGKNDVFRVLFKEFVLTSVMYPSELPALTREPLGLSF